MKKDRPLILLTNDDGIHAEGIRYLKMAAEKVGEVYLVAPETEQSAVGHSITLYDPIKAHEISRDGSFYGYGISGTPADSVKLALYSILPRQPDLVISGINNGANVGINVLYSGTVSAATEAAILGIPAMAVSLAQKKFPPFQWAMPHIERLTRWLLKFNLPRGVALNVNVPALPPEKTLGYKLTRQCLSKFRESFEQREDPRGNRYYWLSGEIPTDETDEEIDAVALMHGYVSITPLFYDLTAHSCTEDLTSSLKKL
ncbi:MAG: 5'/3'-nucleotidase SurE [Desulfomonile tiedjei]|uniref:5'-nucleotidase SurE n=1 Tax=Desulfomonile tiedjei TaxID=2358 RepID=A0A9D6V671_9BACT|nr:5'/3'-nucleotidase SurE [Desulfomonile tiedjei]